MEYISHAECIEIKSSSVSAVIVAEGLRSWQDNSGSPLISRGPRLFARSEKLGRLRVVPDRLGMLSGAAETHAVVLAKLCRGEEMEITQRWQLDENDVLTLELSFIVPPAWDGMETLGIELELPPGEQRFSIDCVPADLQRLVLEDSGVQVMRLLLNNTPIPAGIHNVKIAFHQFSQSTSK